MASGKQLQLLTTKVLVPRSLAGLIERPRLLGMIDQVQAKRLTLIRGGAGFGKTTLAIAFAERLEEMGHPVAWLALDPDDNEPARFLRYVAEALQQACGVGEASIRLLSDISLAAPATIVASLINELAEVEDDVYLIVDDYHLVTDHEIHANLVYLLRHAPSRFHLVLTTRVEPALPLTGLRAENQLLEIEADALRFDGDETHRFLERENISALPADARVLQKRTEGWPALVRIFVSTLKPGQSFAHSLERLSGSVRPIGAYLAEMLEGLPSELVGFMMRMSIVDRLSAPLCHAITGVKSGEELLATMAKHQLLLAPLDRDGGWFRYHPLLAEHLRERLRNELGDEIPWLHRRACRWYAAQEVWTEAVRHAIAAGDMDQAVGWIEHCAMDLVKQGDLLTLMDWQRLFPTALMRGQIAVRLAIAWGLALALRFEEALAAAARLESDIGSEGTPNAEQIRCECETIRSVAIALKDDSESALSLAEAALRHTNDPWTANVASNVARLGYLKAGDFKRFYAVPWIPYSYEEDRRNLFASIYRRCLLGIAESQQLRLATAERHYVGSMDLAREHMGPDSVAAALPASLLAQIRYDQGRLDEAENLILDRVPLIFTAAMLECVLSAGLVLVRIAECRGNLDRAYVLLEQMERLGRERGWGRLIAAALAERIRLYVAEGRVAEGGACLDRLDELAARYVPTARCAWSDIRGYATLARAEFALAGQRPRDSIALLKALLDEAEAAQNHYLALRLTTELAIASFSADEPAQAATHFRRAVSMAAPSGIRQVILDQGRHVGPLLLRMQENLRRTGTHPELLPYLESLLARWGERFQSEPRSTAASGAAGSLSARERTILELIGQGKSNKEIARVLDITPETVKSHVKNLFLKLAVERRAQAVARAQGLGLVRTQ